MTKFQEDLYIFIANYLRSHGFSPLYKEMTVAMGIGSQSKSLITRSLRALEREGKLELTKVGRRLHIALAQAKETFYA